MHRDRVLAAKVLTKNIVNIVNSIQ